MMSSKPTTTSKIRDSCHACAASKVKCPKEKPSCSRCEKKGTLCEYFATRRPGRKRDSRQAPKDSRPGDETSTEGAFSHGGRGADASPDTIRSPHSLGLGLVSPASSNAFKDVEVDSSIDVLTNVQMSLDLGLPTPFPGLHADFGDLLTSPVDIFDIGSLDPSLINFSQASHDFPDLFTSDEIDPNPAPRKLPRLDTSNPSSMASDLPVTSIGQSASKPSPTCCCMTRALELMETLSSARSSSFTSLSTSPDDGNMALSTAAHNRDFSADQVITENQKSIEVIGNILQCSCAENGYLLTMLSMTVLKVLERYAKAAMIPAEGPSPFQTEGFPHGGWQTVASKKEVGLYDTSFSPRDREATRRITAQLILSELHRVQELLNQLSPKLKRSREASGVDTTFGGHSWVSPPPGSEEASSSFSATTLGQMEADLRQRLTALSSNIINFLRKS